MFGFRESREEVAPAPMLSAMRVLAAVALVHYSAAELYGIAGVTMENGAMSQGTIALGLLNTSGDALAFKKGEVVVVDGVHMLDAMTSGCGLVVENTTAYVVGYNCDGFPCPSAKNMSLFGIDVETGAVVSNVSSPLPWWENLDDHHTTLHRARDDGLVVTGILDATGSPRPLIGGAVVVGRDGSVRSTHVVDQKYGDYIKGPTAYDAEHDAVRLRVRGERRLADGPFVRRRRSILRRPTASKARRLRSSGTTWDSQRRATFFCPTVLRPCAWHSTRRKAASGSLRVTLQTSSRTDTICSSFRV